MKTIIEALEILKICALPDVHSHPCEICIELHDECRGFNNCRVGQALARAREIERERQWTTITDDPATWPEEGDLLDGPFFMIRFHGHIGIHEAVYHDGYIKVRYGFDLSIKPKKMTECNGAMWQYLPEEVGE